GARGDRVRQLQIALQQRNFPVGDIDGVYGTRTRDAVAAFQSAQGLPRSGVADQATLLTLAHAPTTMQQVEPGQEVSLVDKFMKRIEQLEQLIIAEKTQRDDTQFRPRGEVTVFPPPGEVTRFRPPGDVALPTEPNDIGALLERLVTLVGRLQTNG